MLDPDISIEAYMLQARSGVEEKIVTAAAHRACPECGGTGGASGCGGLSGYEGPCHHGPYITVSGILDDIESAYAALLAAPRVELAPGVMARDMRGRHVPELPDAGTRYGIAYVADGLPYEVGRTKTVVSGNADVIRAFLGGWAASQGLTDLYGDPERGFAGGYK